MNYKWTPERIEILKNFYNYEDWDIMMKILEVPNKSTIMCKASSLGLKRQIYFYTQEQKEFIANNYGKIKNKDIAKYLNKTLSSVETMLYKLNISKSKSYSEEDKQLLIKIYPYYTNKYIIKNFFPNRTKNSLIDIAKKLGVSYKLKGVKWYDKETLISDFKKFVYENKYVPSCSDLRVLGFPSEATYRRYFGSYRKFVLSIGFTPNINLFGKSYSCICEDGTLCFSKSEGKITKFFIKNKIDFKKEELYSNHMPYEECGNRRFDWMVGKYFIEYFGLSEKPYYAKKMKEKINLCKKYNLKLICLYRSDLVSKNDRKLNLKLNVLLNKNP
jgi:hypothetical protein